MSTRAFWIWNVGMRSISIMITSGAPVPAALAVWNLSYSSLPWPTLVQQTCTSSLSLLKLSTTRFMFGYQPHTVTTGRFFLGISFVQLLALPALDPPSPPEQAASAVTAANIAIAWRSLLLFTVIPPVSRRTGAVRRRRARAADGRGAGAATGDLRPVVR